MKNKYRSLDKYIEKNLIDENKPLKGKKKLPFSFHPRKKEKLGKLIGIEDNPANFEISQEEIDRERQCLDKEINLSEKRKYRELNELIDQRIKEETFHDYLIKLIIKKDFSNKRIYSGANISRQQFSRLMSDRYYTPRKDTIIALAISLEQNIEGTNVMLNKAGYTLTNTLKMDVIVKYYIEQEVFDIDIINEALYYYKIPLLGSKGRP